MSSTSMRTRPGTGAEELVQDALRLAVETVPVLVAYVDREVRYVYANETYRSWFGLAPEEVRGKHLRDVLGPAAFDRIRPHVERALAGERVDYEAEMPYVLGRARFIRASYVPHRGAEGGVAGFVALVSDITEVRSELARREGAERELRESEGRFRAMADSSPVPIWVTDTRGDVDFVNRAYLEFFGVTTEQLEAPGGWQPLIHPEDAPSYVGSFFESIRRRGPYHAQARARRADGVWRWISSYAAPRFGPGGEFLGMVGSSPDVTDMKEVETRLRESAERFRALAETVPSIVFTNAADGSCDYVNAKFFELTGLPAEAALGENWRAAVHPDDVPGAGREWERCVGEGVPFEYRYRIRSRDGGYHWFVSRSVPLRGPSGAVERWVGTATNIHALAEAERRKEEANRTLELLVEERTRGLKEALRELESFSYSIAHDLRAPLRAVHSFAYVLLEDHLAPHDEAGRDFAERLRQSAERMDRMIEDLLAYSRLTRQQLALESVDLEALVVEIVRDMARELGERGAEVLVEGRLDSVRAHGPTLARALTNLIENAAKFVAPGQKPCVRIRSERAGDRVRLWVEDNGIGIPPEYHQKIWGVFERLHKSEIYPGTGIGLAIVRKAMERMGGRAGLESEPGKGSRFYLELEGGTGAADQGPG